MPVPVSGTFKVPVPVPVTGTSMVLLPVGNKMAGAGAGYSHILKSAGAGSNRKAV